MISVFMLIAADAELAGLAMDTTLLCRIINSLSNEQNCSYTAEQYFLEVRAAHVQVCSRRLALKDNQAYAQSVFAVTESHIEVSLLTFFHLWMLVKKPTVIGGDGGTRYGQHC